MIGQTLSHFKITAKLGEGGMGEVWRADDARLDREVAIKVLPADFTQDPERLARFEREAKVLASLDHPNIAGIYEVGESGGVHFLAMQLAPGEDLAAVLDRGPIDPESALAIALQIAEGLEVAHESGIVHRDLKPGNVMVDMEGAGGLSVKLLDFGLAKPRETTASDPGLTHSPTLTARMTGAGTILGTAAYMAPEQARSIAVDRRADIWAFGCILFEMLTGQRPFQGSDVTDVLAAVIRAEPELESLPEGTPARIRALIERCLRKDPRSRLRDIGDARTLLEEVRDGVEDDTIRTTSEAAGGNIGRSVPWAIAGILAVVSTLLLLGGSSTDSSRPVRRFAIDLPWHAVPNWTDFAVAISPTGTHIAHNGRVGNRVDAYVRALDSLESRPLAPAREAAWLFFSPQGDWLGLMNGNDLAKVPVRGGQPIALAELGDVDTYGYSWGPDDSILIGARGGLRRVSAAGGPVEIVSVPNTEAGETSHILPSHLPDGRHALVTIQSQRDSPIVGVVDLHDGVVRRLPINGFAAQYAPSGHLVFLQDETALAVPFDPESLSVLGDPVPVLENVYIGPHFASDGTMIYVQTRGDADGLLVWLDRNGRRTIVTPERRNYSHLDLSNDGERALVNIDSEIYALDLGRGSRQKIADHSLFPIFTPDDLWATFRRGAVSEEMHGAIVRRMADGGGEEESLVEGNDTVLDIEGDLRPARSTVPTSWNSATGELAFFGNASDIWIRKADGTVERFLDSDTNERSGRFSPDGKWLAYAGDETGEYQIYVVPYPGPGPRIPVSIHGGLSPIWAPDGSELLFRNGGKVMAAEATYGPELSFGTPVELFEGPYTVDFMGHQRWDIAPDGEHFLMVEYSQDYRIVIVQNWLEELERLVPTD